MAPQRLVKAILAAAAIKATFTAGGRYGSFRAFNCFSTSINFFMNSASG
jgi:hypothetical protein